MYLSLTFGKTLDLTLLKLAESAVYNKLLRLDHAELLASRCRSGLPVNKAEVERNAGPSPFTSAFHMSKSQMLRHCFRQKHAVVSGGSLNTDYAVNLYSYPLKLEGGEVPVLRRMKQHY